MIFKDSFAYLALLDPQPWGTQQEVWRYLFQRRARQRRSPLAPLGPKSHLLVWNSRCHLKTSWRSVSTLFWWAGAGAGAGTLHSCHLSHRAGGYTTPKECRICRKCAPSSRSSLCCARYTKPLRTDTQRCFILRLTLALSTLHALLEVEWRRKSDLFTFEWPATKLVLLRPSTALNQIKILLLARESWVCTIVLED